jgi:hypothetical protein
MKVFIIPEFEGLPEEGDSSPRAALKIQEWPQQECGHFKFLFPTYFFFLNFVRSVLFQSLRSSFF